MNQLEFRRKAKLLLLIGRSYTEGERIRRYAPKTKSRHLTRSDGKRASRFLREASPGLAPLNYQLAKPGKYRLPSKSTVPTQKSLLVK